MFADCIRTHANGTLFGGLTQLIVLLSIQTRCCCNHYEHVLFQMLIITIWIIYQSGCWWSRARSGSIWGLPTSHQLPTILNHYKLHSYIHKLMNWYTAKRRNVWNLTFTMQFITMPVCYRVSYWQDTICATDIIVTLCCKTGDGHKLSFYMFLCQVPSSRCTQPSPFPAWLHRVWFRV